MKKRLRDEFVRHHVPPYFDLQVIGRKIPTDLTVTVSIDKKRKRGDLVDKEKPKH